VAAEIGVSWRRILLLLVLVAGLGTYLWVYEVPKAREEGKKAKLLGVDKDAITGIDLVFPDREIELKKGDQGWRIVKPVDAPADDPAVKGVVNTLADAEVQRTLDEAPQDLAAFGLDKPNPLVKITVKSGAEPPPIAVGKNTAIGGKSYVRKGDEPKLYLTTSSLQYGLNKQAKDLRDKQLVTFQDDDVQRVDIASGGQTTTLARKGKDAWVVQPGDQPADGQSSPVPMLPGRCVRLEGRVSRADPLQVDRPDSVPIGGRHRLDRRDHRQDLVTWPVGSTQTH